MTNQLVQLRTQYLAHNHTTFFHWTSLKEVSAEKISRLMDFCWSQSPLISDDGNDENDVEPIIVVTLLSCYCSERCRSESTVRESGIRKISSDIILCLTLLRNCIELSFNVILNMVIITINNCISCPLKNMFSKLVKSGMFLDIYKDKKRGVFLVLWLRLWFIVCFKSILTLATLCIFGKLYSRNSSSTKIQIL